MHPSLLTTSPAALIRAYCSVVRRQRMDASVSFEERHTEALATALVMVVRRGATVSPAAVEVLEPTLHGILRRRLGHHAKERSISAPEGGSSSSEAVGHHRGRRDRHSRRATPAARRNVQLEDGMWVVTATETTRTSYRSPDRRDAVDRARRIVRNSGGGEVTVHAPGGEVERVIVVSARR